MSTFPGKMHHYSMVSIDRFDGVNLKSTVYFLSHKHEDHMKGLAGDAFAYHLKSHSFIKLYCSEVTKQLLLATERFFHLSNYIVSLEYNDSTPINLPDRQTGIVKDFVNVTLLPAEHCPGSAMFLFEGNEVTCLYTGDFRLPVDKIADIPCLHTGSKVKQIDNLYLDTTFFVPQAFYIPSREEAMESIVEVIEDWLSQGENYYILLKCRARLGYEDLFIHISEKLKCKIHIDDAMHNVYCKVSNIPAFSTLEACSTKIHACSWQKYNGDKNDEAIDDDKIRLKLPCNCLIPSHNICVRCITVSTMWFTNKVICSEYTVCTRVPDQYRACYSFHSSYSEIRDLIHYLKPKHAYPNVVPQNISVEKMQQRIDQVLQIAHQKSDSQEKLTSKFGTLNQSYTYDEESYSLDSELILDTPNLIHEECKDDEMKSSSSNYPDDEKIPHHYSRSQILSSNNNKPESSQMTSDTNEVRQAVEELLKMTTATIEASHAEEESSPMASKVNEAGHSENYTDSLEKSSILSIPCETTEMVHSCLTKVLSSGEEDLDTQINDAVAFGRPNYPLGTDMNDEKIISDSLQKKSLLSAPCETTEMVHSFLTKVLSSGEEDLDTQINDAVAFGRSNFPLGTDMNDEKIISKDQLETMKDLINDEFIKQNKEDTSIIDCTLKGMNNVNSVNTSSKCYETKDSYQNNEIHQSVSSVECLSDNGYSGDSETSDNNIDSSKRKRKNIDKRRFIKRKHKSNEVKNVSKKSNLYESSCDSSECDSSSDIDITSIESDISIVNISYQNVSSTEDDENNINVNKQSKNNIVNHSIIVLDDSSDVDVDTIVTDTGIVKSNSDKSCSLLIVEDHESSNIELNDESKSCSDKWVNPLIELTRKEADSIIESGALLSDCDNYSESILNNYSNKNTSLSVINVIPTVSIPNNDSESDEILIINDPKIMNRSNTSCDDLNMSNDCYIVAD